MKALYQKLTWLGKISGLLVLGFVLLSLFATWISNDPQHSSFAFSRIGPETPLLPDPHQPPGTKNIDGLTHIMGTDHVGRDVFARLVHGIQNSFFFSAAAVFLCALLGILIGGIMGFFGGWIDIALSRFMEVIGNFPIFLLQLTLLAFLDQSYGILLFVMTIAGWIPYCRFVRAEFFKLRSQEFVQAATVLGASRIRLFFRHLLPNSLTPILIFVPFDLSATIISLGALSFLGFGEPIDRASIGELLKQAQESFQYAWWIAIFPGVSLFLMTISLTLFGGAVRDALDPRFQAHS